MVPGIFPYWNGMYGGPEANEEDPQSHNPLWDMNTTRGYRKNTQLFTDFYAKVKFLKHFSYDLDFYYKDFRNETQSIDTGFGKYSYSQGQYVAQPTANEELHTSMSYNRENQYKLSSVLNYAQTIGRHEVSALAGYEESHFGQRTGSLNVKGLQDPSIGDPNSGTEPFENGGSGTEYSARSFFGRANYAFDNRYLWQPVKSIIGSHGANYYEAMQTARLVGKGHLLPVLSERSGRLFAPDSVEGSLLMKQYFRLLPGIFKG